MMRQYITFSGPDSNTDCAELNKLGVEIGLLYSANPEGRNRYPTLPNIVSMSYELENFAIHICGAAAREQLKRKELIFVERARRIQVNGIINPQTLDLICELYPDKEIITQYNERNKDLKTSYGNHSILVDDSDGRGILPEGWSRPKGFTKVGFAGGLNYDNLEDELPKIITHYDMNSWIDMEGGLRTEDKFDLDKAWDILYEYQRVAQYYPGII